MANYFEVVSKYKDKDIKIPEYKTEFSAGADLCAATDFFLPSYAEIMCNIEENNKNPLYCLTLDEIKDLGHKVPLVPTGIKCHLDPGYYLQLQMRSSVPLKNWIVMANGVGVIDADYYNNPENEGELFLQLLNISPYPIKIRKGDRLAQGIILPYAQASNSNIGGERKGGFGSTNE